MLAKFIKRWLSYLNKDNFDYTQGAVDPFEYHSSFLVFAKLFSVMDYEKLSLWMYISPVCVVMSALLAESLCVISIMKFIQNLQVILITESGTYIFIMGYKLLMISCTFTHKKYYHKLLRALRADFQYICTKGIKYRDKFFENQRLTFKVCVLLAIFIGFIGFGMTVCACLALIVNLAIHSKDDDSIRPLPFPFWFFDYDLHETPNYEIIFSLSMVFIFNHTYTYIFFMQTHIIWVRQITCKADVIIWSIQDLLIDVVPSRNKAEEKYYALLIRHRLREIISMYHSMTELMEDYAAVYKKCLLYEQKFAAPVICSCAFCASEKFGAGEVEIMLALLCGGTIVLMLIPSYLGTFLLEKVQSISDACWEIPFWNAGPVIRPYLVLIMQRSMRPLPITAAGFEDISLQTYSNVIARAYSCFNMLRQANVDFS